MRKGHRGIALSALVALLALAPLPAWGAPPPAAPVTSPPPMTAPPPLPVTPPIPPTPAESASAVAVNSPSTEMVAAPPSGAPVVGPVPIADETPVPSDHDAVVGHLGIEARRFDVGPVPLALRPAFGCPIGTPAADCAVTLGALSVRSWTTRNLAWNAGLVFGAGGGREGSQSLDTYLGVGPVVGLTLLLGNWHHLSVGANPELAVVWFRPGQTSGIDSTTMIALRAALEAELHFGFVGVPALSVGMVAGFGFQYQSAPNLRLWSVGVIGAESIWGTLSNLFVRYYL